MLSCVSICRFDNERYVPLLDKFARSHRSAQSTAVERLGTTRGGTGSLASGLAVGLGTSWSLERQLLFSIVAARVCAKKIKNRRVAEAGRPGSECRRKGAAQQKISTQ